MRRFQTLKLAVLLWAIYIAGALSQPAIDVSLSARLDRHAAKVGEKVNMEVHVKWTGSAADYNVESPAPPAIIGMKITGSEAKVRSTPGDKPTSERMIVYELEAVEEGKAKIGSVELKVTDNKTGNTSTLSTEPMEFEVSAAPAPIFALPDNWRRYAVGGGLFLLAIIAVVGAVLLLRSRGRSPGKVRESTGDDLSPEEVFEKALQDAAKLRYSADARIHMAEIETALLRWVEARFDLPPRKWPDGLIGELREKECLPADHIEQIEGFAKRCMAVKFAGEKPAGEEVDKIAEAMAYIVCGGTNPEEKASINPENQGR